MYERNNLNYNLQPMIDGISYKSICEEYSPMIFRPLILWALTVCVVIWALIFNQINEHQQRAKEDDLLSLQMTVRLFQSQVETAITSIATQFSIARLQILNHHPLKAAVDDGLITMDHLVLLTFVDANGFTVESNLGPDNFHTNLSDREHIRVQTENPYRGIFVGKPVVGRISHKWSVQVTKAVLDNSGHLIGVLVGSLDPFYFERFWTEAYIKKTMSLDLYGEDGVIRTSSSDLLKRLENQSQNIFNLKPGDKAGELSTANSIENNKELIYYETGGHYKLTTVARIIPNTSNEGIFNERRNLLYLGAALSLIVVGATLYINILIVRRNRLEKEVHKATAILSTAIETMPIGVAMYDEKDRLILCNKEACLYDPGKIPENYGLTFQEILLKTPPREILSEDGRIDLSKLELLMNRFQNLESPFERHDSNGTWSKMFKARTQFGGLLVFWVPITIIKRINQELVANQDLLKATADDYRIMAASAKESSLMKTRFIATMGHEVRTPLTAIIGFSRLLLENKNQPEEIQFLNQIHMAAQDLLTLASDTLDWTRVENGHTDIVNNYIDVCEMVTSLRDVLALLVTKKDVNIQSRIDEDVPKFILGDAAKIRQILINLLTNAAKFTDQGSILLEVERQNTSLCFKIQDTGMGIDPSDKIRIFDPFEKGKMPSGVNKEGAGLGLSISKQLANLLQAELSFESSLGVGTVFRFVLPLLEPHLNIDHSSLDEVQIYQKSKQLKILIADDSKSTLFLLKTMLARLGHDVFSCSDGKAALEAVSEDAFDLVILDLQMPVMGGLEFAESTRALPIEKRQYILVAISAQTTVKDQQLAIEAGFDFFIKKPFTQNDLIQLLLQSELRV